jgi:hypothetical protein
LRHAETYRCGACRPRSKRHCSIGAVRSARPRGGSARDPLIAAASRSCDEGC